MTIATETRTCSQRHVFYGVPCSREATFILRRHDEVYDICENAARAIWAMGRERCSQCKQTIWKHWDTEPIR